MRVGYAECKDLSKKVLALAEFLGVDRLLFFVKCTAYRNCNADFSGSDQEAIVAFDMEYGGIIGAISLEILPIYLKKRNMGQKEFSSLYFRIPEGGSNLEACVSAPETAFNLDLQNTNINTNGNGVNNMNENRVNDDHDPNDAAPAHYVDRVPNCCTLLDALNWLNRNGFTHEEKSLQALCDAEVQGIVNYIVLGQLIFSRKTKDQLHYYPAQAHYNNNHNNHNANTSTSSSAPSRYNHTNVIVGRRERELSSSGGEQNTDTHSEYEQMQKEFAMITIRQGEVVVEADNSYRGSAAANTALLEIQVNGVSEKTRISTVEGINTVEGGMNWLHRSRFTQRETRFEEFYRGVVKNFQARMELQEHEINEDHIDLEFMIFSRPLSSSSHSGTSL